jgi:hypothetical protein
MTEWREWLGKNHLLYRVFITEKFPAKVLNKILIFGAEIYKNSYPQIVLK